MRTSPKQLFTVFFILLLINNILYSQTTLATGDIAFTGYNSDGDDYFSIVLLKDITSGTEIIFTDGCWLDANGYFIINGPDNSASEFVFGWQATTNMSKGDQVYFWRPATGEKEEASSGTVNWGRNLSLTPAGDQIFAIQGATIDTSNAEIVGPPFTPNTVTPVTILAGIHTNYVAGVTNTSNWDNGQAYSTTITELPNVLTNGANAIWIYDEGPIETDNAIFDNCAGIDISQSAATIGGVVNNLSNWIFDNGTAFTVPPCGAALPVELINFEGELTNNSVKLSWTTATEVNNYGFEVQKSEVGTQNSEWIKIGFIQGSGTTNSPKEYSFTDSNLPEANKVSYRLKQIDNDGTFTHSKVITIDLTTITTVDDAVNYEFALEQNYPNPFNPTTSIKYQVASIENVTLAVYNILGRQVAILVNEQKSPGKYEVQFDGSNLSSGMYFYKLTSGEFTQTRKLMLLK